MSLLLDALKKAGDSEPKNKATGLSDLQLEDIHVAPARQSSAPSETEHSASSHSQDNHFQNSHSQNSRSQDNHSQRSTSPNASPSKSPSRAAGENLFAAKKAPIKKRKRLGIVPIALIAGGLLGAVGGVYVYIEITPPNQRLFYSPPAPQVAVAPPAPIAPPQPIVVAAAPAPELVPLQQAPEIAAPAAEYIAMEEPVVKAPRARKPAARTRAPRAAKITSQNSPVTIQRQQKPDSIDTILTSAYESYQKGDLATAWQGYRDALAKDAKNRDALLGLAVISQQQGQDDAALHYYRQVLTLDPRDPVALAGLSTFGTADTSAKESRLKQLIAQQPDSAALHFALGNQYVEQSRWSDAQQSYFNALAMEPSNALFAFSLAISLDHLGQRKAAARYYQQAVQFDTSGNSGFNHADAEKRLNELTAH